MAGEKLSDLIKPAFTAKGRKYIFKSVIADEQTQTVIVELIESYPSPSTREVYRTSQISVREVKDGKIYRTRHYMGSRLSFEPLSSEEVEVVLNQ